jgi:hypothetical protein
MAPNGESSNERGIRQVSDSLVEELRCNASQGASVPDLLRLLHGRLGNEATYSTTLAKYFMAAFELPLRTVSPIGGWNPDSTGEISDARIQELIYPEILKKKSLWRGSGAADPLNLPADGSGSPVETQRAQESSPMRNYPKTTLNDP